MGELNSAFELQDPRDVDFHFGDEHGIHGKHGIILIPANCVQRGISNSVYSVRSVFENNN